MALIFAASDVTALLAHFPPSTPTKTQHSLVRSLSGNALYNSRKVLLSFQHLLESGSGGDKIRLDDLPTLLHVKTTDWLFDCYDGPLRFTHDGKSIITSPAFERIMAELKFEAESAFVDLASFAKRKNVLLESIQDVDLEEVAFTRCTDTQPPSPAFVSSFEHIDNVKTQLRTIAESSSDQEIDLSNTEGLSEVPITLLRAFVEETQRVNVQLQGEFEDRGEGIVYVPFAYTEAQTKQQQMVHDDEVQRLVNELRANSFVTFHKVDESNLDQLQADIFMKYGSELPGSGDHIAVLEINEGSKALVLQSAVNDVLEEVRTRMDSWLSSTNNEKTTEISPMLESALIADSTQSDLVRLVLQSQLRDELDSTWLARLDKADEEVRARFVQLFQESVMVPLHLYASAIMGDATLQQNQDTYLSTFFCRELIPDFTESAREQQFVLSKADLGRKKDLNQLAEFCQTSNSESGTKNFKDVQNAVARFAKKRQIPHPSVEQIKAVKRGTLRQKGRAIQKMSRGSDVLQNLIWVLFAQAREGLFVSAGRDTSRMIEHYRSVGDFETWQKLQKWRGLLKAGNATTEDVSEMKALALKVLEDVDTSESVDKPEHG